MGSTQFVNEDHVMDKHTSAAWQQQLWPSRTCRAATGERADSVAAGSRDSTSVTDGWCDDALVSVVTAPACTTEQDQSSKSNTITRSKSCTQLAHGATDDAQCR